MTSLKVGILALIVTAVFSVAGVWCWLGWQLEEKEAELVRLGIEAEELENELAQLRETYIAARQYSLKTTERLAQVKLDLIRIQERYRADLAQARKKSETVIRVIETEKKELPNLEDRELAAEVRKDLPGALITPVTPALFEINRQGLLRVGILVLDYAACREMNLLTARERDTAREELKLEKQISTGWEEQFEAKETECFACAAALETSEQLEVNMLQRLDAERSRGDAWKRKWQLQKYFTVGGFAIGVAGGLAIGLLSG